MITGTINKPLGEKKNYPTQFVMIKNAVGGLVVKLESHDFSTPLRTINFKFDQERNYVTTKWALGVFVTPSALHQMELGYFTFENLDILIEMAEDFGYYIPNSIKEPQVTLKDIAKVLRSGEISELEKITSRLNTKLRNDLIASAQKMYSILNTNTISYLEKKLNISLKPVDLSE